MAGRVSLGNEEGTVDAEGGGGNVDAELCDTFNALSEEPAGWGGKLYAGDDPAMGRLIRRVKHYLANGSAKNVEQALDRIGTRYKKSKYEKDRTAYELRLRHPEEYQRAIDGVGKDGRPLLVKDFQHEWTALKVDDYNKISEVFKNSEWLGKKIKSVTQQDEIVAELNTAVNDENEGFGSFIDSEVDAIKGWLERGIWKPIQGQNKRKSAESSGGGASEKKKKKVRKFKPAELKKGLDRLIKFLRRYNQMVIDIEDVVDKPPRTRT